MRDRYQLKERTKGCGIYDTELGYWVCTMSWMDAARLLWQMKGALRKSATGRRCVDQVHADQKRVNA